MQLVAVLESSNPTGECGPIARQPGRCRDAALVRGSSLEARQGGLPLHQLQAPADSSLHHRLCCSLWADQKPGENLRVEASTHLQSKLSKYLPKANKAQPVAILHTHAKCQMQPQLHTMWGCQTGVASRPTQNMSHHSSSFKSTVYRFRRVRQAHDKFGKVRGNCQMPVPQIPPNTSKAGFRHLTPPGLTQWKATSWTWQISHA